MGTDLAPPRGPRSLARPVGLALGFLLVAASAFVAGRGMVRERDLGRGPLRATITAPVHTGPLRAVLRGTARVVPAHVVSVGVPALPGGYLPVVTGVFVHAGDFVRSGAVVASVAGRPVIVLSGRLPPYRTMSLGDQGADVLQLRKALRSLGYLGTGSQGERYDRATARAVARLYSSRGFTPIPGGGSVPLGEVAFVPHLPAVVLGVEVSLGETASQGLLMTLADPRPRLVGTVPRVEAERLAQGQRAEISFVDGSVIRAVLGPTAYESAPSFAQGPPLSPGPTDAGDQRRVVLVPRHPLPRRLLGAEGTLTIVVAQSPPSSLVVPVTAVFTDPDGRSWVEVIAGGTRSRVTVRLGLAAAGEVVVVPTHGALRVGDRVLVSAANEAPLGDA